MHSLKDLSAVFSASLKITGGTGDTGDSAAKVLVKRTFPVPGEAPSLSPVDFDRGQQAHSTGDTKTELVEYISGGVPGVPVVPGDFEQGVREQNSALEALRSAHIPSEWRDGLCKISTSDPLDGFSPEAWSAMIDDGAEFLAQWGEQATNLGWRTVDIFGLHPIAPAPRVGCWGLAFLIQRGEVVALTDNAATIRRRSNAVLTWRRFPDAEQVPVWDL